MVRTIAASLVFVSFVASCGGDDGMTTSCETIDDCAEALVCTDGECVPRPVVDSGVPDADAGCDPSLRMCGSDCVDTRSDPAHCGGCGMDCGDTPGATTSCNNSLCTTACDEGFADCDGEEANGCETDLAGDDANCGACGMACGGGTCVASTCLLSPRGDGSSGTFTVEGADAVLNSVVTTANGGAGRTEVILGDATGFAAGQLLLLHQTQGPDAGRFELHRIQDVDAGVAIVSPELGAAFGTGAGSVAQAIVIPQYVDLTVASGRVVPTPWNGSTGGIVALAVTGTITVSAGASIDVSGRGFRAGASAPGASGVPGGQGEGSTGTGTTTSVANGSGGGGGLLGGCNRSAGGGGGAGAEPGGPGTGICAPSTATGGGLVVGGDASALFGGGGGAGGPFLRSLAGPGAGLVLLFAESVVVEGAITANGAAGQIARAWSFTCGGGGGGGGGGSIFIDVESATLGDALVVAVGGPGGPPSGGFCGGLTAGAGGAGRISIRADTLTGTTNPPAITP